MSNRFDSSAPPEEPSVSSPGETLSRVSEAIESAIALAEKAVFETGSSVGAIVEESQRQVADLAEILPRVNGGAEQRGIAEAIERQTQVVRGFVDGLVRRAGQQAETAHRAAEMTAGIATMASEVSQIAVTSRVLSLNATIECARLGDAGRAMSVIAVEMEKLSSTVRKTNAQIAKLAEDLGVLLPRVVELATELQTVSADFTTRFSERQGETESSYRDLVHAVGGAFERSRERVDRILKKSQDALSALQFQDPVAQKLRRALDELRADAGAGLAVGERDVPANGEGENAVSPADADADAGTALNAGDTLLF